MHLIETGLRQVDQLTVVVCTLPSEPIPGDLRYFWVARSYPMARVVHLDREIPQEPGEHPDFWRIWRDALRYLHPEPIDCVFSSEDYGYPLAEVLGARHVQVDRPRAIVPVSGTMIREHPMRCWEYIPQIVRPYFVKKVLILGGMSCGKSTLAKNLARHYRTAWMPEYARYWIKQHGDRFAYEDLRTFAMEHRRKELLVADHANRVMFVDTDAITTQICSEAYFGKCDPWVRRAADSEKYDLILLAHPDVPWVAESGRDLGDRREELHQRFRQALQSRGMPYVDIHGNWGQRWQRAIQAVDALLA